MTLGTIHIDGWAGRRRYPVRVLATRGRKLLVTTDGQEVPLPRSTLRLGAAAWVPARAVTERRAVDVAAQRR